MIDSVYNLYYTYWHNVRSGILKYIRTLITISLFSLFILIWLYVVVNSAVFMTIDIFLLITILLGVLPIINLALYEPPLKLVRYIVPERIVEKIKYEN